MQLFSTFLACAYISAVYGANILLTNDDGWAVAQIRAEYNALTAAGHNVILSAPAENESGTGSSTSTPGRTKFACEFNTYRPGSPAQGSDANNTRINYVNGFHSVRYGIQTLAPKYFGGPPDIVVSGSNIGNNLGTSTVDMSGTVGAASEAALLGIPSVAFSGDSGSQVSYTALSDASSPSTKAANIYTSLLVQFMNVLLSWPAPILPPGISLNVNFASISKCPAASDFKFVLARIAANKSATDMTTCGTSHLPAESSVISEGCFATVSVFNASTKADVDAATQNIVLNKLSAILTCS